MVSKAKDQWTVIVNGETRLKLRNFANHKRVTMGEAVRMLVEFHESKLRNTQEWNDEDTKD